MSMRNLMRAALVAATLATASPVLAATSPSQDAALIRADALLAQNQWQRACDLLESRFGRATDNLDALARLGECRTGLGRFGQAIADYRTILSVVDAPIIYARLMVLETAVANGIIVVSDLPASTPPAILSGEISLGLLLDSNANAGTSATSVTAMLGALPLPLIIGPASRATPDNAMILGLAGSYLQPLNEHVALTGRGEASASLYALDQAHSRQSVRGRAGVVMIEGPASLNLQASLGAGMRAGGIDQLSAGLDGRAAFEIAPGLSLGVGGSIAGMAAPADRDRDSTTRSVTMGVQYQPAPGLSASLDYIVSRSDATGAVYSYLSHGPRLGASIALGPQATLDVSYSHETAEYDGSFILFPQGRRDETHALAGTLKLDLSEAVAAGLSANLGYSYRITDSSIDLYDIERHTLSGGVAFAF